MSFRIPSLWSKLDLQKYFLQENYEKLRAFHNVKSKAIRTFCWLRLPAISQGLFLWPWHWPAACARPPVPSKQYLVCAGHHGQAQWSWILTHNPLPCKHQDIVAKYLIIPVLVLQLAKLLAQGSLKIHSSLLQATGTVKKLCGPKKGIQGVWGLSQSCQKLMVRHLIERQVSSTLQDSLSWQCHCMR